MWPDALQVLIFEGFYFDQPIHVAPLPKELQVLKLGVVFDQSLDKVVWPKGLKEVELGWGFTGRHSSPRLADVVWPSGLREMKAPEAVDMGKLPKGCCRRPADDPRDAHHDLSYNDLAPLALGFDSMIWGYFKEDSD